MTALGGVGAASGVGTRRRRREARARVLFAVAASLTVVVSLLIVGSLAVEAWGFIREVEIGRLWNLGWFPRRGYYDVKTLFMGSLIVTTVAMLVATPLGLGTAVYLSEYARPRVRRWLKPVVEVLAGIPSIVVGYFALQWISPNLVTRFFDGAPRTNLLAAGLGVGVLTIPLVASVSEDAMRAVPRSLREAAFGLGARRVTSSVRVVVPAAISGIVAALILGFSRAIGETMVVALAAGGSGGSLFNADPTQPGQTLTGAMVSLAAGTDQVRGASLAFQSLFLVGSMLFVLTFVLNLVGQRVVLRIRERYA